MLLPRRHPRSPRGEEHSCSVFPNPILSCSAPAGTRSLSLRRNPDMDSSAFDRRKYPTVAPRAGYREWAATYEASVPDLLDMSVLDRIRSVSWSETRTCLDLACGTGRTGIWLLRKGVSSIDGVDLTPEMLIQAENKKIYRRLLGGSIEDTGIR